jgi:zinc protease
VRPQGVERTLAELPDGDPARIDESMDVGQGYLAWGFPTAGRQDLNEVCALEVATTILGGGMTSRLYRRLVEDLRLVTTVSAWGFSLDRIGLLGVTSVFAPERRADVEREISSVLVQATEGVTPEEVARAKAMLAAEFAFDNETNAALSGTMGEFEVIYGGAEKYLEILAGIEAVTPRTVAEALSRRLDLAGAARAWVGPDGS